MLAVAACGTPASGGGGGGDDGEDDAPPSDEETPPCTTGCEIDGLDSTPGCGGVYNPDQVLDYHFTMKASDWSALKADQTNNIYFPAKFQCGTDPALAYDVGIRRKRSEGTDKPGLKVNFHKYQSGGSFFSLKKFSLENGTGERKDLVMEYMAWRLMVAAKTLSGRAAFSRVFINNQLIGVYVNVEQVDKRFLRHRGFADDGWLYKISGSDNDGYKTNESQPNPHERRLCYWAPVNPCPVPSAQVLAAEVPMHLDIDQMLAFGAVNAIMANPDAPIFKANNFYWYDDAAGSPRVYFPWDLDTTQRGVTDSVFGSRFGYFTDVLYSNWEDDYDATLTALINGPLTMATITKELDRVPVVASAAFAEDPNVTGESVEDVVANLRTFWTNRHASVTSQVAAHAP